MRSSVKMNERPKVNQKETTNSREDLAMIYPRKLAYVISASHVLILLFLGWVYYAQASWVRQQAELASQTAATLKKFEQRLQSEDVVSKTTVVAQTVRFLNDRDKRVVEIAQDQFGL